MASTRLFAGASARWVTTRSDGVFFPVVLAVATLRLEDGGLLQCDVSVITPVQLFTQDTFHE
ncbi:hypothetical protein [Pectobacterium versatile]|uniref:hypothetical protein n=1 Tax=Pectobacterium versatile TaxID=2488639 RepID=UPI001CCC51EA|nr:hypothetical protein [Pectobacterium versatile]